MLPLASASSLVCAFVVLNGSFALLLFFWPISVDFDALSCFSVPVSSELPATLVLRNLGRRRGAGEPWVPVLLFSQILRVCVHSGLPFLARVLSTCLHSVVFFIL